MKRIHDRLKSAARINRILSLRTVVSAILHRSGIEMNEKEGCLNYEKRKSISEKQ